MVHGFATKSRHAVSIAGRKRFGRAGGDDPDPGAHETTRGASQTTKTQRPAVRSFAMLASNI